MQTFRLVSQQAAAPAKSGTRRHRNLVRFLTPLCVGVVLCVAVPDVNAITAIYPAIPTGNSINMADTTIYIYENEIPVEQPNDFIQGAGVYTGGGDFVGTLDPVTGDITNSGLVVGYAVSGS